MGRMPKGEYTIFTRTLTGWSKQAAGGGGGAMDVDAEGGAAAAAAETAECRNGCFDVEMHDVEREDSLAGMEVKWPRGVAAVAAQSASKATAPTLLPLATFTAAAQAILEVRSRR